MSHEVPPSSIPEHTAANKVNLNEEQAGRSSPSDNDQLIKVLQSGFLDLQRAVEALKAPMPVADKKSTFWKSYMKLADEHDTEFKEKYGTDLDTALIFAGLFSAIGSAFIIQIEPQLAGTPSAKIVVTESLLYISLSTTLLVALLAVLGKQWLMYYQAAGSRGTIEKRGLERQRKLDGLHKWKFDTVMQTLPLLLQLALLLFSTALSVYLWTVNIPIAIIVLTFTLVGFGAYLVLLSSAIISPDSPFQTPLAPFLKHTISLTHIFLERWIGFWFMRLIWDVQRRMRRFRISHAYLLPAFEVHRAMTSCSTTLEEELPETIFVRPSAEVPAVLWVLETSTDPIMLSTAAEMAMDLQWPLGMDLEVLLDRLDETVRLCLQDKQKIQEDMISPAISCAMAYCTLRAAARAFGRNDYYNFQYAWDLPAGFPPDLKNVMRIYFDLPYVFNALETSQATKWALRTIPGSHMLKDNFNNSIQATIEYFLNQFPLESMSTLDEEDVCSYLCCLNNFFNPDDLLVRIMDQKSKRAFKVFLMTQLFENLQTAMLDAALLTRLIKTTSELLNMLDSKSQVRPSVTTWRVRKLIIEISKLCSIRPHDEDLWFDLVVSAAMFARAWNTGFQYEGQQLDGVKPDEMQWIWTALEHAHATWATLPLEKWDAGTITAVDGLLTLLTWNRQASLNLSYIPSEETLKIFIRALSSGGSLARSAFFILTGAHTWFLDPQFQPILQTTVLTHLGYVISETDSDEQFVSHYFELWERLATTPEWKPILQNKFSIWITVFSRVSQWNDELATKCNFVFQTIWVPHVLNSNPWRDMCEESWALAITALAKAWEAFNFRDSSSLRDFGQLVRATVSVTLQLEYNYKTSAAYYYFSSPITSQLRKEFLPELGEILIQAARNVQTISNKREQIQSSPTVDCSNENLNQVAGLLCALGQEIRTKFEPGSGEVQLGGMARRYIDWNELKKLFEDEIASIESSLGQVTLIESPMRA